MVLTSDNSSEDDNDDDDDDEDDDDDNDDDIYIGSAARLKALMKKGPPPGPPVVSFDSSIDSEQDIPSVCTSARASPERRHWNTRNSCKARLPLPSALVNESKKTNPKTESINLDDSGESDACKEEENNGGNDNDDDDDRDYTVDVKVKWKSRGIVRLELKRHETFETIFKHFAESEGVSEKRILVLRGNMPVLPTDTPASVGLRVIDILDGGILNTEVEDEEPKELVDVCKIKVQMSTKGKIVVELGKKEGFERVVSICAEKLNVASSRIKLSFDGEDIGASDTPESLELEEEACIDLRLTTLV